jgi:hypothetical protein
MDCSSLLWFRVVSLTSSCHWTFPSLALRSGVKLPEISRSGVALQFLNLLFPLNLLQVWGGPNKS